MISKLGRRLYGLSRTPHLNQRLSKNRYLFKNRFSKHSRTAYSSLRLKFWSCWWRVLKTFSRKVRLPFWTHKARTHSRWSSSSAVASTWSSRYRCMKTRKFTQIHSNWLRVSTLRKLMTKLYWTFCRRRLSRLTTTRSRSFISDWERKVCECVYLRFKLN